MSKSSIAALRQATGAGVVDIQQALAGAGGDEAKALELLRAKGKAKALRKQGREAREGVVHAYMHANGRVGAMVEVACETDFVARNEDFKNFVHEVALQVAAANPLYLSPDEVPEEVREKERQLYRVELKAAGKLTGKSEEMVAKILEGKLAKFFADACLLEQPSIKEESMTVRDMLADISAKTGEKVEIKRFARFAIGE